MQLAVTALCAITLVLVVSGCGDNTTASTAPTVSTVTELAVKPPPPPKKASAQRQDSINGIVSDYLSEIIEAPSSVRVSDVSTATINKLAGEVADAPRACRSAVRKVSKLIDRIDLSGTAKRKRVLDAMLPVYGDC